MKNVPRILFTLLGLVVASCVFAQMEYRHHLLVEVLPESEEQLQALLRHSELDLIPGTSRDAPYLLAYPEDLDFLRREEYAFRILQEDLERFYAERMNPDPLATMGGYRTYTEIVSYLDSLHLLHPEITSGKFSIGNSVQGRAMWVMKISDNPDVDEGEPEVFYNSLMHPREIVASEALIHFMDYLTSHYGTDDEVTEIVNGRELFFLLCTNPDGHVYNQQTNPDGGGLWRKNRRNNGNGTYGVDIARNYGLTWGLDDEGSSPNPGALAYRGPYAFSEPETQHLRDFVNARDFVISLNYHTYGNAILFPWGTDYYDGDGLTVNDATFRVIGDSMAYFAEQLYGTVYSAGTGWELYYNTNGAPFDWEYGDTLDHRKIFTLNPEVGSTDDGFWPPYSRADSIAEEFIPANLFVARFAGILDQPQAVTVNFRPATNDLYFSWAPTTALAYRLYASDSPEGPFDTLLGTTSDTSLLLPCGADVMRFYIVRSVY